MILPFEFRHVPPEGYSYEVTDFKRNIVSIWICNHYDFSYTSDRPVKSIWGFYDKKKKQFFSPVNAKTVGNPVDLADTTPYSAMPILKQLKPSVLSFI